MKKFEDDHPSSIIVLVHVAVPKQNTEYQYWKYTEVSLPVIKVPIILVQYQYSIEIPNYFSVSLSVFQKKNQSPKI